MASPDYGTTPNLGIRYIKPTGSLTLISDIDTASQAMALDVEAALIPPVIGALPVSPYDGQVIELLVDATLGTIWRMRYRASSASAHKWEWLGGDEFYIVDPTASHVGLVSGAANTWQAINTSLGMAVSFPGDYKTEVVGSLLITSATGCNVANGIGDTAAPTVLLGGAPQNISQVGGSAAQYALQGVSRVPNVTVGQTLTPLVGFNIPTVTFNVAGPLTMRVRPHRLG